MNLKEETIQDVEGLGYTTQDVAGVYVGGSSGSIEDFLKIADSINYDSGYGGNEISLDLVIYFNDNSRLERRERDGSEGWEYVPIIKPKKVTNTLQRGDITFL